MWNGRDRGASKINQQQQQQSRSSSKEGGIMYMIGLEGSPLL